MKVLHSHNEPEIEDDGSQYLLFEEGLQGLEENPVQEKVGEVRVTYYYMLRTLYILLHLLYE
jgi:hypothetical protein